MNYDFLLSMVFSWIFINGFLLLICSLTGSIVGKKKLYKVLHYIDLYYTDGRNLSGLTYGLPDIEKCAWIYLLFAFLFEYYVEDFGYVLRFSYTSRVIKKRIEESTLVFDKFAKYRA